MPVRPSAITQEIDNRIRATPTPIAIGDLLACSVPATGDSLLTHTLPEEEVLATLNRLLEHSASHHFGPGDVLTEAYHTEWEAPNAPLDRRRRIMVARLRADHESQAAHQAAFDRQVDAVQEFLGFLGFSQYGRVHPVRGREPQDAATTRTQTQGTDHTQTNSLMARVGARIGLPVHGVGVQSEVQAETRQETARRTGEQESKKKTLTGFEGPTRVLLGIAVRYRLPNPDQLRQSVSECSLDSCFLRSEPVSGRQRYQALRAQEIRLAQLAGEFFAQVTPPDPICQDWARLAREGYSADLLALINNHIRSGVDWKTRPEMEMGYHLLIYASLMRGAARQMEHYVEERLHETTHQLSRDDHRESPRPMEVLCVTAPGAKIPPETPSRTTNDCQIPYDDGENAVTFTLPFPAFVRPDGSWVLMPDAGHRMRAHDTIWQNPTPMRAPNHAVTPRFMACLEGYEPTPDDLPVAPLATPFESAERKTLESMWREKLHSGDLSARIQAYRALHPISVEADDGKPTLQ